MPEKSAGIEALVRFQLIYGCLDELLDLEVSMAGIRAQLCRASAEVLWASPTLQMPTIPPRNPPRDLHHRESQLAVDRADAARDVTVSLHLVLDVANVGATDWGLK